MTLRYFFICTKDGKKEVHISMITILGISLILQAHDVFYHQKKYCAPCDIFFLGSEELESHRADLHLRYRYALKFKTELNDRHSRLHTCLAFCLSFIRNVLNIKCSVYCKLVLNYFVFIKELFNIYLTNLL